jgi:hypothetical protein
MSRFICCFNLIRAFLLKYGGSEIKIDGGDRSAIRSFPTIRVDFCSNVTGKSKRLIAMLGHESTSPFDKAPSDMAIQTPS